MDKHLSTTMQNNEFSKNNLQHDEINIQELISIVWQGKLVIFIVTTLFAVCSVFYAIHQPNIYKSEALLAPAEENKAGGLSALAGQFGGLASLAGVNINNSSGNNSQLAVEILKSRKFISEFIKRHALMPDLLAVESWDLASNTIAYNPKLYNSQSKEWVREVTYPKKPIPSMQEAYKQIMQLINIDMDVETGMTRLSVEHQSPFIAQQWVNWLVHDINEEMKERDVSEANKSTEFLSAQLKKTRVADIRAVLYKLIEEQSKTIMFANVRDEYVFKTIDPALVPEEKFKPQRAIICIVGVLLGVLLSIIFVISKNFIQQSRKQ